MSTDTVAAERDRIADYLFGFLAGEDVTQERIDAAVSGALRDGYLLDAAAVRREHGERIAKAIEARALTPGPISNAAYNDSARLARGLSPPP